MEYIYELIDIENEKSLKRIDSNGFEAWIPLDEANADYQVYLGTLEK